MAALEHALTRAWRHRGPLAWLLSPLAALMWLLTALRRTAYRRGWLVTEPLPVAVIVVGNRIAGGAGKTPTTIALIEHLQAAGWRPGVLSRGYKAESGGVLQGIDATCEAQVDARQVGDEPLLIWRRTGAPVMVGRDRLAAGRALLASHPDLDVLVCDDGLQHLRLRRDLEIIVFDERGAGNGWLLPAGPLREPVHTPPTPGLRAPPLVLYNADAPSTPLPGFLAQRSMAPIVALEDWWQRVPQPRQLRRIDVPNGDALLALAGIASPQKFFDALRQLGFAPRTLALPDHAGFDALPWPDQPCDLIVTEKDAVKLLPARLAQERPHTRVWVAALHFSPEPAFWRAFDAAVRHLPRRSSPTAS
jgi:tetraacyldisaccharide 4'-kinase